MSATVTYKGSTLTTATNQTRTLDTAGTYLEDDITITDVTTIPTGTKNISITANGTTTEDVTSYASASITANVPNSYTASDEGKVVSSGALVAQTAHADVTPTTSDQTIDTTTNNSIKVKGDADLVAGNIKKDVEIFGVTGSYEGGGGGITGLTYYGTTTVVRSSNNTTVVSFPVIANRSLLIPYYDEWSNDWCFFHAEYSTDGTKYNYGYIGSKGRRTNGYSNYGVTEGAEYMSPSMTQAIDSQWISGSHTVTVPVYLIDQVA